MEGFVLLFGGTAELLKLRQKVLEYAGLRTLATLELEAVRQLVKAKRISLLILSYTVSEDECEEALKVAHSCNPPLKTLMLGYGPVTACRPRQPEDYAFDVLDGPEVLVAKAKEIISMVDPSVFNGSEVGI